MYLFQNLRVRDQVLTSAPSYFDEDEVEIDSGDTSDENEPYNKPTDELDELNNELIDEVYNDLNKELVVRRE